MYGAFLFMAISMRATDDIGPRLAPTVAGLGYELWGIERSRTAHNQLLRLFIDRPEGISVEDCEIVSAQVSDLIEADELIRGSYTLEVSSPGLERPLFTAAQWARFVGEEVSVRLRATLEGKRKLSGKLLEAGTEAAVLATESGPLTVPFNLVERARLVPDWSALPGGPKPAPSKGSPKKTSPKA